MSGTLSSVLGYLDLTGQHNATKQKFATKWSALQDSFCRDVGWEMAKFFDYMPT